MKSDKTAYICFCVEGPSDIRALKYQFEDLFDSKFGDNVEVFFRKPENQKEVEGDLTGKPGIKPDTIDKEIYKYYFRSQNRVSGIEWEDFTTIIQIIDIDGAYIQEDGIRDFTKEEKEMAESLSTAVKRIKTLYLDDHIAVEKNPEKILERNIRKRKNIEYLREKRQLKLYKNHKPKKYGLYYFSSNLDHFLYGKANMSTEEKMMEASDFTRYISDGELLCEFFKTSEYCKETDYNRSWDLLRKGNNSLLPHSNLNILIDEILNSELEDWL